MHSTSLEMPEIGFAHIINEFVVERGHLSNWCLSYALITLKKNKPCPNINNI